MDAPSHLSRPQALHKIELPMLQLVSELCDSNRGDTKKVREIFNEVVFKPKENLEVLSQLSKDHKKKIIELRNAFKTCDQAAFTQLFNDHISSFESQKEDIEPIQKPTEVPISLEKKEKERVVEAPQHDLSKDEELARQLQAEWGGEPELVDDATLARKLHAEMNSYSIPNYYHRRPGHPEMFFSQSRRVKFHDGEAFNGEDPWMNSGVQKIKLQDPIVNQTRVIGRDDPEYIWLRNGESVIVEDLTINKRIYCAPGSNINVGMGCMNIIINQPYHAEINVLDSEVTIDRASKCKITLSRSSKLNFVNSHDNEVRLSTDCTISVYPQSLENKIVQMDAP